MNRIRPALAISRLELPNVCDICGKARSARSHTKCSRIRQQSKTKEWESYMANVEAKKALGGKRHGR